MKHHSEITAADLKAGQEFIFCDKAHQIAQGSDAVNVATVKFRNEKDNQWANGFQLWFNAKLVHAPKTFHSLQNRLAKLVDKWHLESCEGEEFEIH